MYHRCSANMGLNADTHTLAGMIQQGLKAAPFCAPPLCTVLHDKQGAYLNDGKEGVSDSKAESATASPGVPEVTTPSAARAYNAILCDTTGAGEAYHRYLFSTAYAPVLKTWQVFLSHSSLFFNTKEACDVCSSTLLLAWQRIAL